MLSTVINAGKDIANIISNTLLNLSEVETMIKEATNDEPWGPQGSLMKQISDETFSSMNFNEIMTFLWYRIFTERPLSSRRTYKGLVLLNNMLLNGSDYVAIRCKDHISDIRRLEMFSDGNGVPDASIRKKAGDICNLLNNPQKLQVERERAKSNQQKFYGDKGLVYGDSIEGERYKARSTSLDDFDSWEPKSKSIPSVLGESFISFVNTFTQNISGPPPTETHDNYDLPSYYDTNPHPIVMKNPQASIIERKKNIRSTNDNQIISKIELKSVEPTVDNEIPIIDFSEPTSTTDVLNTDLFELNNHNNWVRKEEEDFGDFRGWDMNNDKMSQSMNVNTTTNEFFPDFDGLTRSVNKVNIDVKNKSEQYENKTVLPNKEKSTSDLKLGSTWNDLGSLKIDLDNVCGTKRPMFSKS